MRRLPLLFLLLVSFIADAQEKKDSGNDASYVDVNLTIGNTFFTAKPVALNPSVTKLYYSAGAGYYHRSGLSLALMGLFTADKGSFTIYQASITPAYEYSGGKHIGFGLSYTHYFNKDSVSFYQSPLVNEYYGYVLYKNNIIEPELSFTYATGTQKAKILNQVKTRNVNDYYTTLSLKHEWEWDQFSFTPVFSFTAGSNEYGFNGVSGKGKGNGNGKIRRAATQTTKKFELQDMGLSLEAEYKIMKFYIQPTISFDYYVPESGSLSWLGSLTVGYSF
jgi:hypothetical protein